MYRFIAPAALALVACAPSADEQTAVAPLAGWPDQCVGVPGYSEFRARLQDAVARRDVKAFEALFAERGGMRVNGVGGRGSARDWSLETQDLTEVWADLEEILTLGCYLEEGRIYLPFTASLVEEAPESLIAIVPTALRADSASGSEPVRAVDRGAVLVPRYEYSKPGWEAVEHDGAIAWVPDAHVRSPMDLVLELTREGGELRILAYSGNV